MSKPDGPAPQPSPAIARRKDEHLDIVLRGDVRSISKRSGFDAIDFEHVAMPELALAQVDLSTAFLGRDMAAPLLISSMTGGPARAEAINLAIAEAAQALRIGFGVGSQRVALDRDGAGGLGRSLRKLAPSVPILANFGAAQLKTWDGAVMARRAIDMIEADALIIHLNPLQEAVQDGGDTDWSGLLASIGEIATKLGLPIVAKEVGAGISGDVARRLVEAGVAVIDVAGAGGTSWAEVEAQRAGHPKARAIASAFRDWGIPTATAIIDVRRHCPTTPLIASGGIVTGIDIAKSIRLGADLAALAAGVLPAATMGAGALTEHVATIIEQLRIACFCTASRDLRALRSARLIQSPAGPL